MLTQRLLFGFNKRLLPFYFMTLSVVQNSAPATQVSMQASRVVTGTTVAGGSIGMFAAVRSCSQKTPQAARSATNVLKGRSALKSPAPIRRSLMIPAGNGGKGTALKQAIAAEPIMLYDSMGYPITKTGATFYSAEAEFQNQAHRIFAKVLEEVPLSQLEDKKALRSALTKALRKTPKTKYSFDVSSGELNLSYETNRGEISGSINAYRIVKKLIASGIGYKLLDKLALSN